MLTEAAKHTSKVVRNPARVTVFAAVKSDQSSSYDRERQSQRDFGPFNRNRHRLKRWVLVAQSSSRFSFPRDRTDPSGRRFLSANLGKNRRLADRGLCE
jgi:hypothetical protein